MKTFFAFTLSALLVTASTPYSFAATASDQEILTKTSHVFNEIAQRSSPSVVSITSLKPEDLSEFEVIPGLGVNSPKGEKSPMLLGIGSGVVIRPDGLILTNNHVVENSQKLTVLLDEKHKVSAHVVGTDPKTDLAVIKLDGKYNLPTLGFGNSDQLKVGDWAIAIGSPFGLFHTVTVGTISAKGRAEMGILDTEDFIQTDAPINPGNSGGPLLNSNGEMIGINTAIFSQTGTFSGIGFAIPSKIAKDVTEQIISHGHVVRGWLGLSAQDLDADLAKFFKAPKPQGALISQVLENGPASRAELKVGDVVSTYNGTKVDGAAAFKSLVAKSKQGSTVQIEIYRDGSTKNISILVGEQPLSKKQSQMAGQAAHEAKKPSLGLSFQEVPTEISQFLGLRAGAGALITQVRPGGIAFDAGLAPGDVIVSANNKEIHHARDFGQVIKSFQDDPTTLTVLYVYRGPEDKVFIPLKQES